MRTMKTRLRRSRKSNCKQLKKRHFLSLRKTKQRSECRRSRLRSKQMKKESKNKLKLVWISKDKVEELTLTFRSKV